MIKRQYSEDNQINEKLEEIRDINRLKQFVQKVEDDEARQILYMENGVNECREVCNIEDQEMLHILEERESGIKELRSRRIEFGCQATPEVR